MMFLIPFLMLTAFSPNISAFLPTATRYGEIKTLTKMSNLDDDDSNKSFMDELKQRIEAEANPFNEVFDSVYGGAHDAAVTTEKEELEDVYIVSVKDGLHSIEFPQGSGNNIVLAFESETACDEFVDQLKALNFFEPFAQKVDFDNLSSFCEKLGVHVQIVPEGLNLLPPTKNVRNLGKHNTPSLRETQKNLEYVFAMLDDIEDEGLIEDEYFELAAYQ